MPVMTALVIGEWRSLVAHLLWEQRVAGSNPVSPTIRATERSEANAQQSLAARRVGESRPTGGLQPDRIDVTDLLRDGMAKRGNHEDGGACSSTVELAAHNGLVVGSNPAGPTIAARRSSGG